MPENFEIRSLPVSSAWFRKKAEDFLSRHNLSFDVAITKMLGLYDRNDNLMGCAGLDGNVIKCVAIDDSMRGMNATASLISPLISEALAAGHDNVFLFTKPDNEPTFRSLGFHTIGRASKAIMMETNSRGIASYRAALSLLVENAPKPVGVIIANTNPLSLGHIALINHAASKCASLVIIPLAENSHNLFNEDERIDALIAATNCIHNVTVAPTSPYTISSATFPSYFLKETSDVARTQIELELDIFCRHIAPALSASIRFVGAEPLDPLTNLYNQIMKDTLPSKGIEIDEIDRLADANDNPYSASRIREAIADSHLGNAIRMAAPQAVPAILAHGAALALTQELELTPKPGLVDLDDNGPHPDMNPQLMRKSIEAIRPFFRQMADITFFETQPKAASLVQAGIDAEECMLGATGGVNTHRGALFSLGIAVAAASRLVSKRVILNAENLRCEIAVIAEALPASKGEVPDSHGQHVVQAHNVRGAHKMACEAYPELFDNWLPALRKWTNEGASNPHLRLLLLIISDLDDTNTYHRAGIEGAAFAREEARKALENFSIDAVKKLKKEFTARNISCGGAADMLALTLFINSLLDN